MSVDSTGKAVPSRMGAIVPALSIRRLPGWFRKPNGRLSRGRMVTTALAVAAVAAGFATYGALDEPFGPGHNDLIVLLNIDLALLLGLGFLVIRQLTRLWSRRRGGIRGSRLGGKLVGAFSLAAAVPAVLIAVSSAVFFNMGIGAWFSDTVQTVIRDSRTVADAYHNQQAYNVARSALELARAVRETERAPADRRTIEEVLTTRAIELGLAEWAVQDQNGRVVLQGPLSFSLGLTSLSDDQKARADSGNVVRVDNGTGGWLGILVAVKPKQAWLLAGHHTESRLSDAISQVSDASGTYMILESNRTRLQVTFTLFYVVAALLLLFVAVWFALQLASGLIQSISTLASVVDEFRAGQYSVRVPHKERSDEFHILGQAFNAMAEKIEKTTASLEDDRNFIATILHHVSAGVLELDDQGIVRLANQRVYALFGASREELSETKLVDRMPEITDLLDKAQAGFEASGSITLGSGAGKRRLFVRIARVPGGSAAGGARSGYVVTIDDVTLLAVAQRRAAWSDMALGVAHEIKGPLTPLQMATEYLRDNFPPENAGARGRFRELTDLIEGQVTRITHIVEAFYRSGRSPTPIMTRNDATVLVSRVVRLMEISHPAIAFRCTYPAEPVVLECDAYVVGGAILNIVRNAVEALEAADDGPGAEPAVEVAVTAGDGSCVIRVDDNGPGFPPGSTPENLLEPHVSLHKSGGWGLGLANVEAAVREHGGKLVLGDAPGGGASVVISLPRARDGREQGEPQP